MTALIHRSQLLDCIRAAAILMIIAYHVAVAFDPAQLDPIWSWFWKYGFLGVDVFFPLSGFLITLFLIDNHDPYGIKVFFLRRAFRIIPVYLVAIAVYFIVTEMLDREPGVESAWINVFFLTGWFILFEGKANIPFTITWSLSVEEFAYIICGFSFFFLRSRAVLALIAFALLSVAVRVMLLDQGYPQNEIYSFPPARLDSVFLGALTAIGIARGRAGALFLSLAALLAVQLVLAQVSEHAFQVTLFSSIATGVCLLITVIWRFLPGFKSAISGFFARIGVLAYFLYLFHYFVLYAVQMVSAKLGADLGPTGLMLVTTALSWLAAHMSWTQFEKPLIDFGRRLEGSLARPAMPDGAALPVETYSRKQTR